MVRKMAHGEWLDYMEMGGNFADEDLSKRAAL